MRKVTFLILFSFSYKITDSFILNSAYAYGMELYTVQRIFEFESVGTATDTSIRLIKL